FSSATRLTELASAEQYISLGRQGVVSVARKLPAYLGRLDGALGYGIGNDFTTNTDYTTMYLNDTNRHKLDEGWQTMVDPVNPSETIIFKETDFRSLGLRTGLTNNDHIN